MDVHEHQVEVERPLCRIAAPLLERIAKRARPRATNGIVLVPNVLKRCVLKPRVRLHINLCKLAQVVLCGSFAQVDEDHPQERERRHCAWAQFHRGRAVIGKRLCAFRRAGRLRPTAHPPQPARYRVSQIQIVPLRMLPGGRFPPPSSVQIDPSIKPLFNKCRARIRSSARQTTR